MAGQRLNETAPALAAPGKPAWESELLLGLALTMTAGYVDAIGYVQLGHLYVSFMSGNSTQFGMALAAGDMSVVTWGGSVIALFVMGSFLGALIVELFPRTKILATLSCEIFSVIVALALSLAGIGRAAVLPVVVAMGLQNAIHQVVVGADTGKSFITGTLFGVGAALAKALLGRGQPLQAGVHALSWCAFAMGVVLGAFSHAWFGRNIALTAIGVFLLLLVALVSGRHWLTARSSGPL
ncbi:MAG TPA: YoaK family protein [Rhodopila sp.]|uniref:YoaK family protein n=1 Tax=Rhodopila sp. TaxID=2480087 RepID=UPI002D194829|nr:YoaK family protein [Rhodopila sp.]HVY14279.1 YoaK family protein [Rhodopila sp.]